MKLSVNRGFCTRNYATIQQVCILKLAFGSEKFPGFSRNWPRGMEKYFE